MSDLPKLPDDAWARVELVKLEAEKKRSGLIIRLRSFLARSPDDQRRQYDYQTLLIVAHTSYLLAVFFATLEELQKIKSGLGIEEFNQVFLELRDKTCLEWAESGGDPKYQDQFVRGADKSLKEDTRYLNLLRAIADSHADTATKPEASQGEVLSPCLLKSREPFIREGRQSSGLRKASWR